MQYNKTLLIIYNNKSNKNIQQSLLIRLAVNLLIPQIDLTRQVSISKLT